MEKLLIVIFLFLSISLNAQLFQNLGNNRDGKFNATGLLTEWPENGPELILQIENIGRGWSAPIATDDKILVTGMIDTLDYLSAYDFEGNLLWRSPFGRSWMKTYPDTRSTPTIENNKIWVTSGSGQLTCFELESGKEIWSVDVDQKFDAVWDIWGTAESPLILDNMVISQPAGEKTAMVALNKHTGETIWQTKHLGGNRSYVSPVLYENNGVRLILGMTLEVFFAVDPANGEVVWQVPFRERGNTLENNNNIWPIYANNPIIIGNKIFVTAGWNYGSIMYEVSKDGKTIEELWVNRDLDNQQYGVVEHEGYIYGSNWITLREGNWLCLDVESGKTLWNTKHHDKGIAVLAENLLYFYDEDGFVSLVEPSNEELKVISEFKLSAGRGFHWAHPFINNGKLHIRHGEVLQIFDIKK